MPASRGATIEIRLNEVSHKSNSKSGSIVEENSSDNEATVSTRDKNIALAYFSNQVSTEMSLVINMAVHQFGMWLSLSDNIQAQRNIADASNFISKSISVANGLIQGYSAAGIPGLIVASFVEMTKLGVEIFKNYQQQEIQINQLQVQLDYSRERSGYSLTSGGR